MKLYRIKNQKGEYSTGGGWPRFKKNGKLFDVGGLKTHLNYLYKNKRFHYYENVEIEVLELSVVGIDKDILDNFMVKQFNKKMGFI